MNVYLGPELDRFVAKLVKTGLYQSQSEVLREALRLLKREEQLRQIEEEEIRAKIQQAIDSADAGRVRPLDESAFERIRRNAMRRQSARRKKAV